MENDNDEGARSDDPVVPKWSVEWPESGVETGGGNIDNILARLQDLPQLPSSEHAQAYTEVHDELMAELDAGDGSD